MDNKEKIKKINDWQNCKFVHLLTCGNNSNHKSLKPVEKNNTVILVCENCDYKQTNIPDIIFKNNFAKKSQIMEHLYRKDKNANT